MKKSFNIYEAEKNDQTYRQIRRDNFITSHPEDLDRMGKPYSVNFTPMFPLVSLQCFHLFHKHVSSHFTFMFPLLGNFVK